MMPTGCGVSDRHVVCPLQAPIKGFGILHFLSGLQNHPIVSNRLDHFRGHYGCCSISMPPKGEKMFSSFAWGWHPPNVNSPQQPSARDAISALHDDDPQV